MRQDMHNMVSTAQDSICAAMEAIDSTGTFREDSWDRPGGGGGRSRVLQDGTVFEKAGVNVSAVHGTLPAAAVASMRSKHDVPIPDEAAFFATGVSLVLHPHNPMAPTVHANYRYFELEGGALWWFGGGADLTPSYLFEEDAIHFHQTHKDACDKHDPAYYPRFKKWCDDYFHIVHRGERRGIGGIFFDDLNDREPSKILPFSRECAGALVPSYLPILERRLGMEFTEAHRRWQQLRRGRYVEFNLVWDRGTTFGLKTGARTESVLMSLPLTARWEYDVQIEPGSPEARLQEVLHTPVDWLAT